MFDSMHHMRSSFPLLYCKCVLYTVTARNCGAARSVSMCRPFPHFQASCCIKSGWKRPWPWCSLGMLLFDVPFFDSGDGTCSLVLFVSLIFVRFLFLLEICLTRVEFYDSRICQDSCVLLVVLGSDGCRWGEHHSLCVSGSLVGFELALAILAYSLLCKNGLDILWEPGPLFFLSLCIWKAVSFGSRAYSVSKKRWAEHQGMKGCRLL